MNVHHTAFLQHLAGSELFKAFLSNYCWNMKVTRFRVLTVVLTKMQVFFNMMPRKLVNKYQHILIY